MAETYSEKGRLPACTLDKALFDRIWRTLGEDGEFIWQAVVGTGGDLLGQLKDRPQEIVTDRARLYELLAVLPRIDSLQFTAEIEGKGAVSFTFRSYNPPAGALVVAGQDAAWTAMRFAAFAKLFAARRDERADRLYGKAVFAVINSVAPLAAASVIAVVAAVLLVPSWIRQSEFLWWVTAGTVVFTLWLASKLSNRLIARCLQKRPYIRWLS
ncbi:hypothetical protein [Anaeroselena agilis]|uniref:Uncharacterized protein n=1 Tax=Anaeroselena agilis TaxID=3063788 RepID=A0ABU3NTL0_9FIRM|nr:hypothetical protein [Selenomonadales bacterium 4137-cl]